MNTRDKTLRENLERLVALMRAGEWGRIADRSLNRPRVWWYKRRLGGAGANFWVEPPEVFINPQCLFVGHGFHAHHGWRLWVTTTHNGAHYQPQITIGNHVSLGAHSTLAAINQITIKDHVRIASFVYITDHNHGTYSGPRQDSPLTPPAYRHLHSGGPVIIEERCWIGERAVILSGVHIGPGCVIAANSVVTRDVPANTISAGVPSRPIRRYDFDRGEWLSIG